MTPIQTFFLRVTAMCCLDCDYCYVFKHADQSYRKLPAEISSETVELFSIRLSEYVKAKHLNEVFIVLHGGEPLLLGVAKLDYVFTAIREKIPLSTKIEFSLQTNGVMLTRDVAILLNKHNCSVSISLDGPKHVQDLHRLDHNGHSSFQRTMQGFDLIKKEFPKIYTGVIGVIDPKTNPQEILEFYREKKVESADLLLPDSTYLSPPEGREDNIDLYKNWLIKAFDLWFDCYSDIQLRTFDLILAKIAGLEQFSDLFGLGSLSYLVIETDGSYHTTDTLKITYEGASATGLHLAETSIEQALTSSATQEYNRLLTTIPSRCKLCSEKDICAGGSIPHRYSGTGFNNPTVYCKEFFALIEHCRFRLTTTLQSS